jgi:hypothetical protein
MEGCEALQRVLADDDALDLDVLAELPAYWLSFTLYRVKRLE